MKPINLYWFERLGFLDIPLHDQGILRFLDSRIQAQHYEKGELITYPGHALNKIGFTRNGLTKGIFKVNNYEIVNWISAENDVIAPRGVFWNQPSIEYIEALEPTIIDYLTLEDIISATENFKSFRQIRIRLLEQYYYFAETRALLARIPNATERIRFFKTHIHKSYYDRAPRKDLASFLGMTQETLSRLYNKVEVNPDAKNEPSSEN